MTTDPAVRRVTVALIRAGNAATIPRNMTDEEVLQLYGALAEPLAAAFVDIIREEVRTNGSG